MGRKLSLLESMTLKKGDTFEFGVWRGKSIEWQVLDVGNGILCISKYCLEKRGFDSESNGWEKSELRQWLNSDFFNKAFSSEEKIFLMPYEGDKVNLLSAKEVKKYLPSSFERETIGVNGNWSWWWLRSRGINDGNVAYVSYNGNIEYNGNIDFNVGYIRPVIFLKRDIEKFLEPEV